MYDLMSDQTFTVTIEAVDIHLDDFIFHIHPWMLEASEPYVTTGSIHPKP
jgi:hypothetical protein